jgi:hypothetical protein
MSWTGLLKTRSVKVDEKLGRVRSKKSSGRPKTMIKLSNKSSKHFTTIPFSATEIVNHKAGKNNAEEMVPVHYTDRKIFRGTNDQTVTFIQNKSKKPSILLNRTTNTLFPGETCTRTTITFNLSSINYVSRLLTNVTQATKITISDIEYCGTWYIYNNFVL